MEIEGKKPVYTIGIPTFNRASILKDTLIWLCKEVGNRSDVEILISDNCSTDKTEEVAKEFTRNFTNVVYFKQPTNIGFDSNLLSILKMAKGKFVQFRGDDDVMKEGVVTNVIKNVIENQDIDLFFCNNVKKVEFERGKGFDEYIRAVRGVFGITFITSLIIKKEAFDKIENTEKYIGSGIYQMYLQMELLKQNENFGVIEVPNLQVISGRGGRRFYNLGDVFIKSYFDILGDYLKYGLSDGCLREEKLSILNGTIIKLVQEKRRRQSEIGIEGLVDFYKIYYSNEPYYEERLKEIERLSKF